MKKLNKHQWLAVFYIAFGALMIFLASRINFLFAVAEEDVGPKFFPTCCGVGFILCGMGKLLSSSGKKSKAFIQGKGWLRLALIVAILLVYVESWTYMGYIIPTFLLLIAMTYMLSEGQKPTWWKVIIFSAITTAAVWFAFVKLMNVMLPAGKWIKALLKLLR